MPVGGKGWSLARQHYRALVLAAATIAAIVASLVLAGNFAALDGPLYDLSVAAAVRLRQPTTAAPPRVVVVALDRRSLAAPELEAVPRVLLGPQWGKLIEALVAAEAKVIGFDIIFSFSANGLMPGYDKPFLDALARHRLQVVLGRSLQTAMARPFFFALGANRDPVSVGFSELTADSDGVIRHIRPTLPLAGGERALTLAAALARRAGAANLPAEAWLVPPAALETLPSFALVDVLRCAARDPAKLASVFAGRIVLVGSTLPEEDRKRAPDHLLTPPMGDPAPADTATTCALPQLGASAPEGGTVPGVYLQAAAVQALLGQNAASAAPALPRTFLAGIAALIAGAAGLFLAPWLAVGGVAVLALALFAMQTTLLAGGLWLPIALPVLVAIAAMVLAYLIRFLIEERRRRRIQHAFGHYLAPAVVERLIEDEDGLRLGGQTREVSIMFADLSGFTALSGKVAPERLMELTNGYLQIIAEAVDATGGYVDKFIGDAVMAIWGAPAKDAEHAASAAGAALAAANRIADRRAADQARGEAGFSVKIGVNSGFATVGNVGAPKRYNYTAVGETVNIASRLESVPGDYGCRVVLGPRTAASVKARFLVNELDWIKVKGKVEPLAVYELVCPAAAASAAERDYVTAYAAGLAAYRAKRFAEAEAEWRAVRHPSNPPPEAPSPARVMAARAAEMQREPPPADWDGVWVKSGK